MKHWHRCSRWKERFEGCPFSKEEGHDDDDTPDDDTPETEDILKLEGAPRTPTLPLRIPAAAEVGAGVRRIPIPASIPDPAGVPVPVPAPPGLPDIQGLPFPQEPGIDDIVKIIQTGKSQVPARWRPSDADMARMLAKLGMAKGAAREDVLNAAAEVEAVSAYSVGAGVGLDQLWPVALIPLMKHLRKARATTRAGVVGRPGRMDPPSQPNTFRTGAQKQGVSAPRPGSRGPQQMFRAAMRPPVSFPAMSVNMAARMKQLMSLSPRRSLTGGGGGL